MDKKQHHSANLSLIMLIALVTGNMVGSGIFTLPATLASFGTISLYAWAITAIGAMLLAYIFAQWSILLPKVGGPYAYCREAFGNFIGFEVAYSYWIAIWVGNAAVAVAFASYLAVIFPIIQQDIWVGLAVKIAAVWVLSAVNLVGIKSAAIFQLVATFLKLLPLILIGLIGIFFIHPEYLHFTNTSGQSNFGALNAGATLTFWAFVGLESATVPADDVKQKSLMAYATLIGTAITAGIYILCCTAIMGLIPPEVLSTSSAPFADAVGYLFPAYAAITGKFIAICAAVTCIGSLNGWILLQGQIPKAAADDGLFPGFFQKENQHGTPIWGIIISSILVSALLFLTTSENLLEQFNLIIILALFFSLLPYSLSALGAFFYVSQNHLGLSSRYCFTVKITSILATAFGIWAICGIGWQVIPFSALVLACGIPAYYLFIKKGLS